MGETRRRLAGVLAADVVGYSAMVGADEPGTLARVRALRVEVIEPLANTHHGRLFKTTGDGFFVEFASAVEALRCAIAIQDTLRAQAEGLCLRIGVHQGEVVPEGDDLLGDGVIVAARLEPLAEPGGVCISSRVREDAAGKIALEVDDLGEPALKNIAAKIRVFRVRLGTPQAVPGKPALALPDKPSIAVLPFANMSGDPEQEYFADGMVEEIITALSRIRWLFVIARNSTFTYKGQTLDLRQVGRDLGVRYLLEGSVRKVGGRVRIAVQLIEAETAIHLWADRFDGPLDEVFALQDQVAIKVAGVIEPALTTAETARSAKRPTSDLTAYDAFLRANAMLSASGAQIPQALALLEAAIARDPNYGPALALAAICCFRLCADGSTADPETDRRKGMDFGHGALRTARDDPAALANAAFALGWFGEDIGSMIAVMDRALALNPSHARGWYISGTLRLFAGEPEIAIEHLETALRLSPRARLGTVNLHIGMAHLVSRRFDEALPKLLLDIQDVEPSNPGPYRYLAACYAHMGRLDDARRMIERLRAITPLVLEDLTYWRNPEHRDLVLSGLRLAMGETA